MIVPSFGLLRHAGERIGVEEAVGFGERADVRFRLARFQDEDITAGQSEFACDHRSAHA